MVKYRRKKDSRRPNGCEQIGRCNRLIAKSSKGLKAPQRAWRILQFGTSAGRSTFEEPSPSLKKRPKRLQLSCARLREGRFVLSGLMCMPDRPEVCEKRHRTRHHDNRREASILRSIRTNSVRDPRSELSIVISRMQNSGHRRDRQIAINAAMMMRRGEKSQDIAKSMLEGRTQYNRRARDWEPLYPADVFYPPGLRWRDSSRGPLDKPYRIRSPRGLRNCSVGGSRSEPFAFIGNFSAKEDAQRLRDSAKEITHTSDGREVKVRARVVQDSIGIHSVWIRATEVRDIGSEWRKQVAKAQQTQTWNRSISANNRVRQLLSKRRRG